MWGWTIPVKLTTTFEHSRRPCIYFRRGRFVMAYAYPIPGTEWWYAGSSLISQRLGRPSALPVMPKFARWRELMAELGQGYIKGIAMAGTPVQGWRPVPAQGDDEWVTEQPDGSLACRPLWHSGVRQAPLIYEALRGKL
jgi:hypothetical protein